MPCRYILSLAMALCAALMSSCGDSSSDQTSLHLSIDLWPGYYPAVIAQEQGLLTEHKVDLQVTVPENTDRMIADFMAGKYDAICVALGDAIDLAAVNPDIRLVLISDESAGGDALLGTSAFKASKLPKGAKIGTNIGGFGEVFVTEFLKKHDIDPQRIELVNVDAAEVPQLLKSGALVAAHTWEPYVSQAKQNGAHLWFDSSQTPGLIPDGMIVRGSYLKKHPDAVKALLQAWFQASSWWQANRSEGDALIAKHLNLEAGSVTLDGIKLLDQEENMRRMNDKDNARGLHKVINQYSEFFLQRGVITHTISADELIDAQFLK